MEQLNTVLPELQGEYNNAAVAAFERKPNSPLLEKVRQNFGIFGSISIVFGLLFAFLFYRAGIGINILLFTAAIILLLYVVMKKLSLPVKKGTKVYYAGAFLLGASSVLTASGVLQLLNILGILFLLDLSLLHQFYEERHWDFVKHVLRMFGLGFQSIAAIAMPFIDSVSFMKHIKIFRNDKIRNIFIGIIISIPFLLLVTVLLSSADLLFGKLADNTLRIIFSSDLAMLGFMVLFGFLACYCIICASVTKPWLAEEKEFKKADASVAITLMILLSLVYALFCGIQVIYLFANGLFVLPEGFTFAEYARRGFFELLAVAILNVTLMVLCRSFFRDHRMLRITVTFMTLCTYIMIASAAYRMLLYISVYHLTFLRVFVLLSLLIIALVLAGVIIAQYNQRFPLFRYCIAVISICYIAFSFTKPDYFIAKYLIDQKDLLYGEDVLYLTRDLSLDAAPAVLPLLADENRWTAKTRPEDSNYDKRSEVYDNVYDIKFIDFYRDKIENNKPNLDIRSFNYSVYLADQTVKDYSFYKKQD